MVPFEDSSFDLVTAVCVYHHVPPPERAALTAEIARTLKPGGTLAIIEHNPFNPMTQIVVKRCPVDINAILLRAGEAKALQQQAGLTPYATSYFLFVPEMLFRRLGGIEPWLSWLPAGGQYMQLARRG
jgi:SAM-dependent methyltransferase